MCKAMRKWTKRSGEKGRMIWVINRVGKEMETKEEEEEM